MNEQQLSDLFHTLAPADWQALKAGANLLLIDDSRLEVTTEPAQNVLLRGADYRETAPLSEWCPQHAAELLEHYYRTTPLSRVGFDTQVLQLVEQHGGHAFAAPLGAVPICTLFVEGGVVVAETAASPRHRYGAFLELDRPLSADETALRVARWIEQESAYEHYLSMNMCRYNC